MTSYIRHDSMSNNLQHRIRELNPMATTQEEIKPAHKLYRGQSAAERIAERRQRLIETAIALYGSAGFRATSVKTICLAAGLTERYFYESFANGEALLCAAYTQITDNLRLQALAAMALCNDTLEQRAKAAAEAYFAGIQDDPAAGRVILFEMEGVSATVDAHFVQELSKTTELFLEWFFSEAQEENGNPLHARIMAQGAVGALYQIAKEWIRSGFALSTEVMAQHMQVLFLGIRAAYTTQPI